MALRQDQIDVLYRRLWDERLWPPEVLQEALRQEWDLWYGKRFVKATTPPCLQDLAQPQNQVKVMKRRRLRDATGNGIL